VVPLDQQVVATFTVNIDALTSLVTVGDDVNITVLPLLVSQTINGSSINAAYTYNEMYAGLADLSMTLHYFTIIKYNPTCYLYYFVIITTKHDKNQYLINCTSNQYLCIKGF